MQTDIIHDALADPALKLRRKIGACRFAQIGQIVGQCKRGRTQRNSQRQKQGSARKSGQRIQDRYVRKLKIMVL
jgi:hypothetical protein